MFGTNILIVAVATIALIIIGWLWCKSVFRRFHQDLDELRSSKVILDRVFILIIWLITFCIIAFTALVAWAITLFVIDSI